MNQSIELIEKLQGKEAYCVDVFPCVMPDAKFFQVEKVFLRTKLKQYAEKICDIFMVLWGLYDLEIYLTEFPENTIYKQYASIAYSNIADMELEKLCKIVKLVIVKDISSVEILCPTHQFEMSIGGGFHTVFYNIDGEHLELVQSLAEHEGLYIRKCDE